MEIKRDSYLSQLKSFAWDGQVKVITGIRRCGKSYLLRTIYRNYLYEQGVKPERIITIELDLARDIRYRNPLELASYVRSIAEGTWMCMLLEVTQKCCQVIFSQNLEGVAMKYECIRCHLLNIIQQQAVTKQTLSLTMLSTEECRLSSHVLTTKQK